MKLQISEPKALRTITTSYSGCMGLCAKGSNVMIYPQKVWFSEVFSDDLDEIVSTIERTMSDD
jgi:(2Fe-2S) ferredoxin